MRIGYLSTLYHTSHILRIGKVVSAEWRVFGTGMEIISAFESNKIDLAYIGLTPAIVGIQRGLDIVCIAGGHVEGTVIAGRVEKRDFPENLNGKVVGVPAKGSIHDVILRGFAENVNFEIRNYPWAEMILDDFIDRRVDVICGTPNLAVLAKKYEAEILSKPSEVWPWNPSYGIVVRRDFIDKNQEKLRDFLIKHEWGTNILRESMEFSARILSEYLRHELNPVTVKEILNMSPKYCASLPERYIESTMKLAELMVHLEYIENAPKSDEIFYLDLISDIHPQKEHYSISTATP